MFATNETQPRISRTRRLAAAVGLLVLAAASLTVWLALRPSASVAAAPVPLGQPLDPPAPPEVLVFVSGAVAEPGLYRLSAAARISDAIAAAGGMTADADPGHLPDLAARVHDGRQVNVPFRRSGRGTASTRLDINSAALDELSAVPGMPIGLPAAIVQYRDEWGPFLTLTDLRTALGVDATTLAALRPYLRVVSVTP